MTRTMSTQQKAPERPRQSQAQRREATRNRILEATLTCLARYGYASTGVAQVVAEAGVSRGAWSHHFPSMQALILETAQHLMTKVYERLAIVLRDIAAADDRMRGIIYTAWGEFFASEVNDIYLELLVAARRDEKLAAQLKGLSSELEARLTTAAQAYFEPRPGVNSDVTEIMYLNRWLLRGIALDAPLMPEGGVERALAAWSRVVGEQIQPRR